MDHVPQISCIIPFWNEGHNLLEVLDEITRVRNLDEIICVDDASQDGNAERVRNGYPGVNLVRLEKNTGKSGAVKEGISHAKNELILLIERIYSTSISGKLKLQSRLSGKTSMPTC